MYTSSCKMMLTVALILAVGVGASGAARADDLGKFLLGAAVGVLAYKALDDDHGCRPYYGPPPCPPVVVRAQPWGCAPYGCYVPPPSYGYYAPAPRVVYVEPRVVARGYGYYDGGGRGRGPGHRR
jgi:hypothetical protein